MRGDLSDAVGAWDAFWLLPVHAAANPSNLPGWHQRDTVERYGANNEGVYSTINTTDPEPTWVTWQQDRQGYSEILQPTGHLRFMFAVAERVPELATATLAAKRRSLVRQFGANLAPASRCDLTLDLQAEITHVHN